MAPLHTKSRPKTPKAMERVKHLRQKAYRIGNFDPWKDKRCEYNLSLPCNPSNCPKLNELRLVAKQVREQFKGCCQNKQLERSKLKAELFADTNTLAQSSFSPSVQGVTYGKQ